MIFFFGVQQLSEDEKEKVKKTTSESQIQKTMRSNKQRNQIEVLKE